MLQQYLDYAVPLLRVLADMPGGGGSRKDVAQQFLKRFGEEIPKELFERSASSTTQKWEDRLYWAQSGLKVIGLIDRDAQRIWQITQAGRDWLAANPDELNVLGRSGRRSAGEERPPATAVPQGITLEMLERTRQVMSPDQFRQIWGGIYEQVLAEERRKAITPVNDRFLAERARAIIQRIQDFLQGRSSESPKSETVCDWIFFCYSMELYREGASLWRYVNKDEVNAWHYERTSKLSAACRARVG